MRRLDFRDHRSDPAAWARELGVSRAAVDLYLSSDIIDLHVDSFLWHRAWGYDLTRRHGRGFFGLGSEAPRGTELAHPLDAAFVAQVDFPRIREAAISGAIWSITTNPFRTPAGRARTFLRNLGELRGIFASVADDIDVVRNAAEYRRAKAAGKHAAFIGIQGGNALDRDLDALDSIPDDLILRITLVHLSTSKIGVTSSPFAGERERDAGLSTFGKDYVRRLDEKRIFVDLAHINRKGFFDAVEVHDPALPLIATHTGVCGVTPNWRNLDDAQLRAIAATGGTVGIIYQCDFLGDPFFHGRRASIVDHLEHVIRVIGEDHASLGSDWDGLIVPPRDMPSCLELPRLVQTMLDRGWGDERVRKVLGGNALRAIELLRG